MMGVGLGRRKERRHNRRIAVWTVAMRKQRSFGDGLVNASYPTLCCRSQSAPVGEEGSYPSGVEQTRPQASSDDSAEVNLSTRLHSIWRFGDHALPVLC